MTQQSLFDQDITQIKNNIVAKLKRHFGATVERATPDQVYKAVGLSIRDEVMDLWTEGRARVEASGARQVYYLSAEFLMGRALTNNMINLGRLDAYRQAVSQLGFDFTQIEEQEADAGLGNGGLGRLAACFLDSLATLELPAVGCGIRYEFGLFRQRLLDGEQVETPDNWIERGYVWEVEGAERYEVRFDGEIRELWTEQGLRVEHQNFHTVYAVPFDMPIVGYESRLPATLRLWSARAVNRLDLNKFNRGEYTQAEDERELAEVISKVLYPENTHQQGRLLRLKQFYFLSSATMQSIVARHKRVYGDLRTLPDKVAVQINDTHPTLAIPELMRILLDEEGLSWDEAFAICGRVFNYTNHTVMAEALEKWDEKMFAALLPRIYQIVKTINDRFCQSMWQIFPQEWERISDMAIIAYGEIRMPNLCLAVCGHVNGVSQLHADILKTRTFRDFYVAHPDRFLGITNGVTTRRWLALANPGLTNLLTETIGPGFIKDWTRLAQLEAHVEDPGFLERFAAVKAENKRRFADFIYRHQGAVADPQTLFDVQAKRLHEYKRQLLKVIHILHLYDRITNGLPYDRPPVTFIFAAKAPPGYEKAKNIIRLINAVGRLVNNDPRTRDKIQVLFVENYGVSVAEKLIPAADISEQLSTAGREASGTGNMKFMLNGAITLGTMDGANIEIYDQVGADNIFIFGATVEQLNHLEALNAYRPGEYYERDPQLRQALEHLIDGSLPVAADRQFNDIYHSLLFGDYDRADKYYLLYDFQSYADASKRICKAYFDQPAWNRMAAVNTARAGFFSSDRTIAQYDQLIWHLQ